MGSNMMRQAVPLLNPEAPIVGTGIEKNVALDSRVLVTAESDGIVEYVDAAEIVIRHTRFEDEKLVSFDDDVKTYKLTKFSRTNQNTCTNLRPIVRKGDKVKKVRCSVKVMEQAWATLHLVVT
jgi:DNA-directed RNA polymerase subunit beta